MQKLLLLISMTLLASCGEEGRNDNNTNSEESSISSIQRRTVSEQDPDIDRETLPSQDIESPVSVSLSDTDRQSITFTWIKEVEIESWKTVSLCQYSPTLSQNCKVIKKRPAPANSITVKLNSDDITLEQLLIDDFFLLFQGESEEGTISIEMPINEGHPF